MGVLIVSVIAIVMSGMAVSAAYSKPATVPDAARTVEMTLSLDIAQVTVGWNDTCACVVQLDTPAVDSEVVAGEFIRWAPNTIVINHGDTVKLTVKNPLETDHGFVIDAPSEAFTGTTVVGLLKGTENGAPEGGSSAVITFTALKPGTYVYRCPLPFIDATHQCHPDHEGLTGTLIVL
jgi:FtsP/CotA-like multicopper oxidase with cupredoxin domain